MSLSTKTLKITIQLASNTGTNQPNMFAGTSSDSVDINGLRTSVRIQNAGALANCTANIRIWGLTPSLMNQLSTLGIAFNIVPRNIITVAASDDGQNFSNVFIGTIHYAYADYSAQPDVPFHFFCYLGGAQNVISANPTSTKVPTDVATLLKSLAGQMAMGFENNGVTAQLPISRFSGAALVQARKIAEAANIELGIVQNTMVIFPKGGSRTTANAPTISKATGMISYPAFTQQGIIIKSIWRPEFAFGAQFKVDSPRSESVV
jgi:hypothetical protein